MVRIKNRYLLIQVLYPQNLPGPTSSSSSSHQPAAPPAQPALLAAPQPSTPALLRLYAPTPDFITGGSLLRALRAALATLFGEHGAGACTSGLAIKYWSNATSGAIVRCRREAVRLVWAAIALVNVLRPEGGPGRGASSGRDTSASGVADVQCVLRVLRVSGTMRKCEEEAIRRARGMLGRARGLKEAQAHGVDVDAVAGLGARGLDDLDENGEGDDGSAPLAIVDDEEAEGVDAMLSDSD